MLRRWDGGAWRSRWAEGGGAAGTRVRGGRSGEADDAGGGGRSTGMRAGAGRSGPTGGDRAASRAGDSAEDAASGGADRSATESEPVRAAAVPGQIDAAAVRRIWPDVLDAVKRRRRTTHALLMNVSVQSLDAGTLTLAISSEPLSRLLAEEINLDCVRGAVKDVLGVDWRVRVALDGGGGTTGPAPAVSAGPAEAPRHDPRDDPRDEEPDQAASATVAPAPRPDPEGAAISLLESQLGARRIDPNA